MSEPKAVFDFDRTPLTAFPSSRIRASPGNCSIVMHQERMASSVFNAKAECPHSQSKDETRNRHSSRHEPADAGLLEEYLHYSINPAGVISWPDRIDQNERRTNQGVG